MSEPVTQAQDHDRRLGRLEGIAEQTAPRLDRIERVIQEQGRQLRQEIAEQGRQLGERIAEQGRQLEERIAEQGRQLEERIAEQGRQLNTRLEALNNRILWAIGTQIALMGLLFAALKLT